MRIKTTLFILVSLLLTQAALATTSCPNWPAIFEANRRDLGDGSGEKVLIGAFENRGPEEDDWLSESFYFVLSDYFELFKKFKTLHTSPQQRFETSRTEEALQAGKMMGADYVLFGFFKKESKLPVLKVYARFLDVKKGEEIIRKNWSIDFPNNDSLFDLLLEIASEGYTQFTHGKHSGEKTLTPYKHISRSMEALRHYTNGRSLMESGEASHVDEAVKEFLEGIRADYNYVPAYLGHAEALLMQHFIKRVRGGLNRQQLEEASADLNKASLLHPFYTERYGTTAKVYLEAETHTLTAIGLFESNKKKSLSEFRKSLKLLPGDIFSMKQLGNKKELKRFDPCHS